MFYFNFNLFQKKDCIEGTIENSCLNLKCIKNCESCELPLLFIEEDVK